LLGTTADYNYLPPAPKIVQKVAIILPPRKYQLAAVFTRVYLNVSTCSVYHDSRKRASWNFSRGFWNL